MPSNLDPLGKPKKPKPQAEPLRVLIGLAIVGGAILWSFHRRSAEMPAADVPLRRTILKGESPEIRKILDADRAYGVQSVDVLHLSNQPKASLPTEAQQQIVNCMARAEQPLVTGDVSAITSLDDLQRSLGLNEAPHRQRLSEVVTFQTSEQNGQSKKFRARLAPTDEGKGMLQWQLFEIAADGLPDVLKLPDSAPEKREIIAKLLSRAQVLEHDREELYTWSSGATAEVKIQDETVTEIALRFDKSLLGCTTSRGKITCKCL